MTNKNVLIGLVVVVIIAIGGYFFPGAKEVTQTVLSGMPFVETQYFQRGVAIGDRGTVIPKLLQGSGAFIYTSSSVTASTTKAFDIAVTGVVSTDRVFVQTATTTANGAGWLITGASASSTAGYITVLVANNSGATGNVPRNIASSTPYLVIKAQ